MDVAGGAIAVLAVAVAQAEVGMSGLMHLAGPGVFSCVGLGARRSVRGSRYESVDRRGIAAPRGESSAGGVRVGTVEPNSRNSKHANERAVDSRRRIWLEGGL